VKKKLLAIFNAWLPPIVWAGLIFFLSNQSILPKLETASFEFLWKKTAHMTVYGVLYLLFWRAIKSKTVFANTSLNLLILPLFFCFVYALTDEFHQSFVPGRQATLRDIGYDTLGVLTAFLWKYRYI